MSYLRLTSIRYCSLQVETNIVNCKACSAQNARAIIILRFTVWQGTATIAIKLMAMHYKNWQ